MNKEYASRVINKEFMDELKVGKFKELTTMVREDKSLLVCFRGNYINIYYQGRSMFKVIQKAKDYKISFDFNHAKFTIDWKEKKKRLEEMNYSINDSNELWISASNILDLHYFWNQSADIIKGLMDDYLDVDRQMNYMENKVVEKKDHLEKLRQQQIMKSNQDFRNNYFIYDREFTQPRNSNKERKYGQFDMLALRQDKDQAAIVFIELKSKKNPNNGKSNIQKHYEDYINYIRYDSFVQTRKIEAIEIIKHNIDLGLVNLDINAFENNYKDITTEMLYVFTDDSIDYFRENKDKIPAKGIILENNNWRL